MRRMWLRGLFERLDTSPGQEKVIQEAIEEARKVTNKARSEFEKSRTEAAEALRSPTFEAESLGCGCGSGATPSVSIVLQPSPLAPVSAKKAVTARTPLKERSKVLRMAVSGLARRASRRASGWTGDRAGLLSGSNSRSRPRSGIAASKRRVAVFTRAMAPASRADHKIVTGRLLARNLS